MRHLKERQPLSSRFDFFYEIGIFWLRLALVFVEAFRTFQHVPHRTRPFGAFKVSKSDLVRLSMVSGAKSRHSNFRADCMGRLLGFPAIRQIAANYKASSRKLISKRKRYIHQVRSFRNNGRPVHRSANRLCRRNVRTNKV